MARDRFFHFSGDVGFKDSFDLFEDYLANKVLDLDSDSIPILEHTTMSYSTQDSISSMGKSITKLNRRRGFSLLETLSAKNATHRIKGSSMLNEDDYCQIDSMVTAYSPRNAV